jgi:hypothetical protein
MQLLGREGDNGDVGDGGDGVPGESLKKCFGEVKCVFSDDLTLEKSISAIPNIPPSPKRQRYTLLGHYPWAGCVLTK